MNTSRFRFKVQRGNGKMRAIAALLFGAFLMYSPGCSDDKTTPVQAGTPAPEISEIVTTTIQDCGYYTGPCPITVHYPVIRNKIGPIPVVCSADFSAVIQHAGGQGPITYSGSGLPAGMTLGQTDGVLRWQAPCSAAGQTLSSSLVVADARGLKSEPLAVSFLVQSAQ